MAQIGFPLMLGHIACFLISLFFLFEQMFITAIAKGLPSSLVITDFWVQSWISGSRTWFPQMPRAWCRSQCPVPASDHAMQCVLRSSSELLLKHFVHLNFCVYADFLYWTEPLKTMFFFLNATASPAVFICHCDSCVVGNKAVRLLFPVFCDLLLSVLRSNNRSALLRFRPCSGLHRDNLWLFWRCNLICRSSEMCAPGTDTSR